MKSKSVASRSVLNAAAFQWLLAAGVVVDARAGGLVVGKTLEQGGITVIRQKGGAFHVQKAKLACSDYVLHPGLAAPRFEPQSDEKPAAFEFSQLLVTTGTPDDKILWLTHDQVVVPAERATPHLPELNEINDHENPFLSCNLRDVLAGVV